MAGIPFGQRIEGLLGSPLFNLGIGLLAASGPRPLGQGSGTGERLADALKFASQRRAQSMELQAARDRLAAQRRRRQLGSEVQTLVEMLSTPAAAAQPSAPSDPTLVGSPTELAGTETAARFTPLQGRVLGMLAQEDPVATLGLLSERFLADKKQQEAQSPIGKMLADLEIAEQRGDRRSAEALKRQIDTALADTETNFDDVRSARNDVIRNSQEFLTAQAGFDRVLAGFGAGTPAGDIAGIFGWMKTVDPSSVVREREFATAENAGSVPERIRGLYNRLLRGERLTPDQRQDFTAQAQAQFGKSVAAQQRLVDDARGFAERNSLRVEDVVPEFVIPRPMETIEPPERDSVLTDEESAELERLRRELGFN